MPRPRQLTPKQRRFVAESFVDMVGMAVDFLLPRAYYVYCLVDGRSGDVFYVGKGRVRRAFKHLRQALNGSIDNAAKFSRIRAIYGSGSTVLVRLDSIHDSESMAFVRERELIATIGPDQLTNMAPGQLSYKEQSQKTADALLSMVMPLKEWKSRYQPTVFHEWLYHRTVLELQQLAQNGQEALYRLTMTKKQKRNSK